MDVRSEGRRIHYEVHGEGDPIVLIHGFMQAAEDWVDAGYPELLGDRYRLVIIDTAGFGKSDRPTDVPSHTPEARVADIDAVLDAEGIGAAHIWGYSYGVWVAQTYARLRPERTSSLVLGGSLPGLSSVDMRNLYSAQVEIYRAGDWDRVWREIYPWVDDHTRQLFQGRNDLPVLAACWAATFEPNPADELPLPTPLFCYVGTSEWFWEGSRDVAVQAGGAFAPIEGADHGQGFRRSGDVVSAVRGFLEAGA